MTGKSSWFKNKREDIDDDQEKTGSGVEGGVRKRKLRGEVGANPTKQVAGNMMETTSVMFVESTPHGILTSRLRRSEDLRAEVVGWRVKMVEMGGTKLGQLFANTDPWSGGACERADCYTCHQGGGADKLEDCFRRNILYESRCMVCTEEQQKREEGNVGTNKRKRKAGVDYNMKGIYVGESSRSLYERTKEHRADAVGDAPDSHMRKH